MNLNKFKNAFNNYFPTNDLQKVTPWFEDRCLASFFDSCFDVQGMCSIKKQMLLKIAASCVGADESYLEVGTYSGKSLISALQSGNSVTFYACDDFSEQITTKNTQEILMNNLLRYGFINKVRFFNGDFRKFMNNDCITVPVAVYFYDGAHDLQSQYDGIKFVESLLAEKAIVIIDDWRFGPDSASYAKKGTEMAISESARFWELLYELPARFNGDLGMWWNGIAVYATWKSEDQ